MTIEILQNARNWAAKHQKFASGWGNASDPAGVSPRTPEMAPLLKFLGTPLLVLALCCYLAEEFFVQ